MSILGLSSSQPENMFQKSLHHRRNDSGELDVFEAAKYFSGANEIYSYNGSNFGPKMAGRAGRLSLDMPLKNAQNLVVMEKKQQIIAPNKENSKKHKQPSSPGGRLASFLNSLFNQTSSKKKKSKSVSIKDQDQEIPSWRRKRRSSISHFRTTNSSQIDPPKNKSCSSNSVSGFRTPPPLPYNSQTPSKSYVMTLISTKVPNGNHFVKSDEEEEDYSWLDDKLSFISEPIMENYKKKQGKIQDFKKFNEGVDDDEGGDSDSSSDLFELPNYDLDCFSSSGLPVYETTNMDSIKRSTVISTAH
ncbi:hypothetical protein M9H77_09809 [Catharanthus roseus]|uniref:Uncharacterized protein n=1 Tax=Catharanthus roseus TaxID=4058 RepID=A0ACC0C1M5_CATRO|nr:hypothetical protein M9H77_09809 [Catharanthus roseus]